MQRGQITWYQGVDIFNEDANLCPSYDDEIERWCWGKHKYWPKILIWGKSFVKIPKKCLMILERGTIQVSQFEPS